LNHFSLAINTLSTNQSLLLVLTNFDTML